MASEILKLTAAIVASHASMTELTTTELVKEIKKVHSALSSLAGEVVVPVPESAMAPGCSNQETRAAETDEIGGISGGQGGGSGRRSGYRGSGLSGIYGQPRGLRGRNAGRSNNANGGMRFAFPPYGLRAKAKVKSKKSKTKGRLTENM